MEGQPLPIPDIRKFQRNLDANDAMSQHSSRQAGPADQNATYAELLQSSPEFPGHRQ